MIHGATRQVQRKRLGTILYTGRQPARVDACLGSGPAPCPRQPLTCSAGPHRASATPIAYFPGMDADEFRIIALSFPDAYEHEHMGHPDFRVGRKIFASIGPLDDRAMVKLTPDQQAQWIRAEPDVFEPAAGAWGRNGSTYVRLSRATEPMIRRTLTAAFSGRRSGGSAHRG